MEINKKELHKLYMEWVDEVTEVCDWKSSFGPEEIVNAIANILEKNPNLINLNKPVIISKEKYDEIISASYRNYLNNYSGNYELDRNEFINASKTAPDFSEHWGLKFEKRELTYSERYKYWFTHNYETGMEYGEGEVPDFDNAYYEPTPTHAIMVSYNNESAEIYE